MRPIEYACHAISLGDLNGILCIYGSTMWLNEGRLNIDTGIFERHRVASADFLPLLDFPIESFHLGQDDGCLQCIHTTVDTDSRVVVAPILAMDAYFFHGFGQGIVVGKERAAITIAAERLAGEEAGGANRAECARFSALVGGTKGLGSVLDYRQTVLVGDFVDGIHVRALPV